MHKPGRVVAGVSVVLLLGLLSTGCYDRFVPDKKDYFSANANYSVTSFTAILGRTNVFINIFNADYSTQPLDFTIENVRHEDSSAAPELLQQVDAREWKTFYQGNEKTLAEVEAKRYTEKKPIFEIRPHSGELFFWNTDSSKVKPGTYYFDVRVKNHGGEKVFHNLVLSVRRPHPYDPYEFDDITGERKEIKDGGVTHPTSYGMVDELSRPLPADSVYISFRKTGTGKTNTVSFIFLDQDSVPISLSHFNTTKWDSLKYHSNMADADVYFGFNRKMNADSTKVTFDITNPFPVLADVSTNWDVAHIDFSYNRISFNHRVDAGLGFSFSIYEPGNWDVIFQFHKNPKFDDD
ncbi:hypothetical protein GCM10023143_20300 [Compostibacter hankyongensis]|uniref:DUF5007 domain-containing protein n=2 Tax=Compostibacter hankyongensis TaxID=1007089 RepID=A0ABP8FUK3_9BACT